MRGWVKGSLAFVGAVALFPIVALTLAFLLATLRSCGEGSLTLTDIRVDDTGIRLRQPNRGRVRLDLTTGAAALDESASDGGRTPQACLLGEEKACVLPSGVFQIAGGRVTGRTDAGEWKGFYFPLDSARLQAIHAADDKLLIESSGRLSTLECVEARSGRSLWMYVHARTYNESGPYAPSVPGRPYEGIFEPAEWQARQRLGVNATDSFDEIEGYAGKMVFNPMAVVAKEAAARTLGVAGASWLMVGSGAVFWWRRGRTGATIVCLAAQGVLLLIFGFLNPWLLAAFALQGAVTAAEAWRIAGRGGRVWIGLIVFGTATLLLMPPLLWSLVRT